MTTDEPHFTTYYCRVYDETATLVFESIGGLGCTAREAALSFLAYHWPADIHEKDETVTFGLRRQRGLIGKTAWTVTAEATPYSGNKDSGTWTVGQLLLDAIAAAVRERRDEKAKHAAAREELAKARTVERYAAAGVRVAGAHIEDAAFVAAKVGVDPAEVEKAKRARRARRKASAT